MASSAKIINIVTAYPVIWVLLVLFGVCVSRLNAAFDVKPGNRHVGVFANRSPFRPNNLGLSVLKLQRIDEQDFSLTFSGVDMLSQSPIYDIKPYIPYADKRDEACSEWANDAPEKQYEVVFLPHVAQVA